MQCEGKELHVLIQRIWEKETIPQNEIKDTKCSNYRKIKTIKQMNNKTTETWHEHDINLYILYRASNQAFDSTDEKYSWGYAAHRNSKQAHQTNPDYNAKRV